MKSPFPGMDPYIESSGLWPDFHHDLIAAIKHALLAALPARYFVQTGDRSYIVLAGVDEKEQRAFLPDVGVLTPAKETKSRRKSRSSAVAELAEDADAVTMHAFVDDHHREHFIEIYESNPERRLVTCIEVLSPSNKRPGTEGWEQYLRKRNALLLGSANFIEIDLLRGGRRMPMIEPWPISPYYLLVARKMFAPSCRVWRADYRKPLPEIPVPLSPPDADVKLALQPLIEAIYDRSRYAGQVDYTKPLSPSLGKDDATWLAKQLAER